MQINLLSLSETEGKTESFEFSWPEEKIHFQAGVFPVLDPGSLRLTIRNIGKKVLMLQGEGSITVGIPCDRCLTQTPRTLSFSFERKIDGKLSPQALAEELDGNSYLDGMNLDAGKLFFLEALLIWPLKVLCRENCKGLCSRCGKNLNEGPCSCMDAPPDPRMARILDIWKNAENGRKGSEEV